LTPTATKSAIAHYVSAVFYVDKATNCKNSLFCLNKLLTSTS